MTNLPTESEIYGNSKKDKDVIVLNIYNKQQQNDEESNASLDNNQTEANLKLDDNYYNKLANNPMPLQNNNFVIYDNTRDNPNPYPFSENRGVQRPAPPIQNQNNYWKSVNPQVINDKMTNDQNYGKININSFETQGINTDKKKINIARPNKNYYEIREKKYKIKTPTHICIFCLLLFFLPPFAAVYCCFLCQKKYAFEKRQHR